MHTLLTALLAEFALEVHLRVVESTLWGLVWFGRGRATRRDWNAGLHGTNESHGCIDVVISETPLDPVARDCPVPHGILVKSCRRFS